jgi:hypothetical protein
MPEPGQAARRWPRPGRAAAATIFVLGAVVACFPKALSPRWVFFSRDTGFFWYPIVATFVRVVGEGSLPLWDPYESYGAPLWADPGSQVAYPPTWLNLLLLPDAACKILVIGHLLLAGAGTYALLRRWRLGVLPAATSAVTFACAGPVVSAGSLISPHLCGLAWLPWALWGFERVLERGSRRDVAVLGLLLAAQALTGSAEACAISGLAALLRWSLVAPRDGGAKIEKARPVAAAMALGALLASVQWLPTLGLAGRTTRMQYTAEAKLTWSVHPAVLADVLVPQLVADMSMGPEPRRILFGGREPFLASLYLGAATLPLVLLALRSERPHRRWAWVAFTFFLLLSLGLHFAPARALLALPPLSMFRYPAKYLWGASLAWAVLAGLGTEVWWRAWSRRDRSFGAAVGAVLLALAGGLGLLAYRLPAPLIGAFQVPEPWRAWMAIVVSSKLLAAAGWIGVPALLLLVRASRDRWARASALAVVGLAALDLTAAARPVNPLAPAELFTHRPPLLERMAPVSPQVRLLSIGGSMEQLNQDLAYGPRGWDPAWNWALGVQEMIRFPLGTRWNLRGSYDGDISGLASPEQALMSGLVAQVRDTPLGLRLLQMGNVGWVIDPRPDGFPLLAEAARSPSVYAAPLRLLRVPDPLPPCYLVGTAGRAATADDAIRQIASAAFDPRRQVLLDGAGPTLSGPADFAGTAVYQVRRAGRLRIETDASDAAVLVTSETFDPDWRATVDGAPATIERANVLFRGVHVPPGRHLVEMTYFPRAVGWGIGATALGLVMVGLLLRPRRAPATSGGSGDGDRG